MMPVDFLSDAQVGAYGRFVGSVSELDLERFFFFDDDDLTIVGRRRGAANRMGFTVQLGIAGPTAFGEYSVRAEANERLFSLLSDRMNAGLAARIDAFVDSVREERVFGLGEPRCAPVEASGPEMAKALKRVAAVTAVGASTLDPAGIIPGRLDVLARRGLSADASTLRRMSEQRRRATVFATVASLQVSSVDDVLDLFAVLMATKLIGTGNRASS